MYPYKPAIKDILFAIENLIEFEHIQHLPSFEEISLDLVQHILEEAEKLSAEVIAPLNKIGDAQGCVIHDHKVHTPKGWKEAYEKFYQGGWNCLPFPTKHNGQGLPWSIAIAAQEMFTGASMAFSLCPLLNQGAIELLCEHGSDAQHKKYLDKLMSGEWTGTMNLTEPQAGSDLAAIKTKAVFDGKHYRISGQKIYITYGDHDLTENILHMVLARTENAPEGVRGLSLFLVPKYIVNDDGSLEDEENDLHCVSLEHKLGIHASPTAVISYGDKEGSIGYLIGEENAGIKYMFTMMNNARLGVGLQGLAISERAYQQALSYAQERTQGKLANQSGSVKIIEHPDIRRMLALMKCKIEAMRYLSLFTASQLDYLYHETDKEKQARAKSLIDILIPIVKAWSTDQGVMITSEVIQIFGGMGYVEESGVAQHYRDAKIGTIYEGTNGIQANDLALRKVGLNAGKDMGLLIAECEAIYHDLRKHDLYKKLRNAADILYRAIASLKDATKWMVKQYQNAPQSACYAAVPYLELCAISFSGGLMLKAAIRAHDRFILANEDEAFYTAKINNANIYAQHILTQHMALSEKIKSVDCLYDFDEMV